MNNTLLMRCAYCMMNKGKKSSDFIQEGKNESLW